MNKKDIDFSKVHMPYGKESSGGFLYRCLPEYEWNDGYTAVSELIMRAGNTEELIDLILGSDELKTTQIYAELSKRNHGHITRLKSMAKWHTAVSDAGALKIGNENFNVLISNGYGDGTTYWAVAKSNEWNHDMLDYFQSVRGKFNVYEYDCGSDIMATLEGRFSVYYGYKFVVFEKD